MEVLVDAAQAEGPGAVVPVVQEVAVRRRAVAAPVQAAPRQSRAAREGLTRVLSPLRARTWDTGEAATLRPFFRHRVRGRRRSRRTVLISPAA